MNEAQKEITLQVLEKLKAYWEVTEGLSISVQGKHITNIVL